ncbi:MAG TPA: ABC transporter permease [Chloroflexi bacterium]|nr:ABC transporter permease [Chloroflexota bacterium]
MSERIKRVLRARETGVLIALLLMCIFLWQVSPAFLTVRNLLNIGRQISLIGIMAIGMTFVLISREIDLSVGSIYALSGLATGMLLIAGAPLWLALLIGLLIGVSAGATNGLLSTYGLLPSFIATLGMMSVLRGIALLLTNGQPVTINESSGVAPDTLSAFFFIGQGRLLDVIPMQLVFFIAVSLVCWILLSKTVFGFRVYAVGGSDKAARVSGIKVYQTKILAFIIMGFLAALSGILSLAFLPSGQAGRTGVGVELDVIAAAVIGGASLSGGEGTILGTILGVLIIGVLRNGLVLTGVSPFWQEAIIGLVIILAVGLDKWTSSRRRAA